MTDITTLNTKNWQHKLGTIGEVVTELDDIAQCYDVIFSLIKHSVVNQPNLGLDMIEPLGEDPKTAIQLIKAKLFKELPKQEPRGEIVALNAKYDNNGGINVELFFKKKNAEDNKVMKKEWTI